MNRRSVLRAGAGIGAVTAVAGCLSARGWFGSSEPPGTIDDRDGAPSDDGRVAWPQTRFGASNARFNPNVDRLAENPTTTRLTDDDAVNSPYCVSVTDESLYWWVGVGSDPTDAALHRRDPDGAEGWTREGHVGVACPIVTPDVVYASTGSLTAFDADTGDPLWIAEGVDGVNVVHDGELLYAEERHELVALDPTTGDIEWELAFEGDSTPTTGVAADAGIVYAFDRNETVYAFDAADGSVEWERALAPRGTLEGPVVAAGDVVLVTTTDTLVALEATSGETVWRHGDDSPQSDLLEPTVADDRVFVSPTRPDPHPVCLDLETGTRLWDLDVETGTESPVAVADALYYPLEDGGLVAVTHDGEHLWRLEDLPVGRVHAAVDGRILATVEYDHAFDHLYAIEG